MKCEADLPLCLYLSPKHSPQVAFGFPNHRLTLELTVQCPLSMSPKPSSSLLLLGENTPFLGALGYAPMSCPAQVGGDTLLTCVPHRHPSGLPTLPEALATTLPWS